VRVEPLATEPGAEFVSFRSAEGPILVKKCIRHASKTTGAGFLKWLASDGEVCGTGSARHICIPILVKSHAESAIIRRAS